MSVNVTRTVTIFTLRIYKWHHSGHYCRDKNYQICFWNKLLQWDFFKWNAC